MAKYTITPSPSTSAADVNLLANIKRPRHADTYRATIFVYGTFAGSTVTVQFANGSTATLINAKDVNGSTMAYSADGYGNLEIAGVTRLDNSTDVLSIYATAGTSTGSASLTIDLYDNL